MNRDPAEAPAPPEAVPRLDPGEDGHVAVDRQPVVANPPVRPEPLDLPARPGQELVDATEADALAALERAGRIGAGGEPDLDAGDLQPQVSSAQPGDPSRPGTVRELVEALLRGNLPPELPVDPLALLDQLPDGIPHVTYRVCSESKTKQVTCSITLPLGVPAVVDVTGDRTPDVLADLLPAAEPGDVVGTAREVLDLQRQIEDGTARLTEIADLLADPGAIIDRPQLLLEKLRLEDLLRDLGETLREKTEALIGLVNLGVGLLALRLPTSEMAGEELPGHVWAVYDLPERKRISVGFDGFRRGSGLPLATLGMFTFDPAQLLRGRYDINASLLQVGAGASLAVTAGLASVADTEEGAAYDPTVASARFSPVPASFDARAQLDPGASDRDLRATIDARSSSRTHLDTQVLSNRRSSGTPTDTFDQLKVSMLPTEVSASVARQPDGDTSVNYQADSTIDEVFFADHTYAGNTLNAALQAQARGVPASWNGTLTSSDEQKVNLDYRAAGELAALDVAFFDRDPSMVLRGSLRDIPTAVTVDADVPGRKVLFDANDALGSAEVTASRDLGAFAPLEGDHTTLVMDGADLGISARVTGLKRIEALFGDHPRGSTEFRPGGQRMVLAGQIGGDLKSRLDISNIPERLSFDLNTAEQRVTFRASSIVDRVRAAHVDTDGGPSAVAAIDGLPESVDVRYSAGSSPEIDYQASSTVPRAQLFVSEQGVEVLDPGSHHYLSAELTGVPDRTKVLIDLPRQHLEGTSSTPLGGAAVVARVPFDGRDYTAIGELTGVPAKFDADWPAGSFRFRGISGPIGSARFAVRNHEGARAPVEQHVAAHYRELTGDLDASALVRDLTLVNVAKTDEGLGFDMRSGDGKFAFDGDFTFAANGADDTRYAALGRVSLPSQLDVSYRDGNISYRTDRSVGLEAESWIGKVAAIEEVGAVPVYPHGIAVEAMSCESGPGCAEDDTTCTMLDKCFGAVAVVNLPGLPTTVDINVEDQKIDIVDYHPPKGEDLTAYVRLDGLIDGVPSVSGRVDISDMPETYDLHLGPFGFQKALDRQFELAYEGSAEIGKLKTQLAAELNTREMDSVRGLVEISSVPKSLRVNGKFASSSRIGVVTSHPVEKIIAHVTGMYGTSNDGGGVFYKPATAKATISDIPKCEESDSEPKCVIEIRNTDNRGNPLEVPIVFVDMADPGLDVEFYAVGSKRINASPVSLHLHDMFARLVNLGKHVRTDILPNGEGTYTTLIKSDPKADELLIGGAFTLQTERIGIEDPALDLTTCDGFAWGTLHLNSDDDGEAYVQIDELSIGRIWVGATDVRSLTLEPGEFYLAYGVDGDYGEFTMGADEMKLKVDGNIRVQVLKADQEWAAPLLEETVKFNRNDTYDSVTTHLYDQKPGPIATFHLKEPVETGPIYTLDAIPRLVGYREPKGSTSGFTYKPPKGSDHKMVFTLLDPSLPESQQVLVDLAVAKKFSPFEKKPAPWDEC